MESQTVYHLTAQRQPDDADANYVLRDEYGSDVAKVQWLNVNGARVATGEPGTIVEFGGKLTVEVTDNQAGAYLNPDE